MEAMEDRTATIDLPRFGECTYTEAEVIDFSWGLPGFPNLRRWLALSVETQPNFVWLQSLDDVKIALPATDPYQLFDNYDPKLPPYAVAALEIEHPGDFTVLCVVIVTEGAAEMSINLLAPVVINLRTRRGRQIMLENSSYSVREPMPRMGAENAAPEVAAT
jgi:flagellar assembly factor FliW